MERYHHVKIFRFLQKKRSIEESWAGSDMTQQQPSQRKTNPIHDLVY